MIWPKPGRGRNRQFFKSKPEAQAFFQQKQVEDTNSGHEGLSFTETQRAEYREATAALKPYGKTVRDALAFYLPHLQATNRTCTPSDLAAELIKALEIARGTNVDVQRRDYQSGSPRVCVRVARLVPATA